MGRRLVVAIALLAGLSGCAVNQFVCARKGGYPWRELTTEHFLLSTDHSAERARELAFELERIHDALSHTLVEAPKARALVHVVVMRSWYEWELFSPASDVGGMFIPSFWGDPTIVFPGSFDAAKRRVIAHELTHLLYAASATRQPPWFREGIATYAETLDISAKDDRITLGKVSADRAASVIRSLHGGMRELLRSRGMLTADEYGLAWILVHFLVTEHSDQLGDLEERFSRGEDPLEAWRAVFPDWDPEVEGGPGRLEEAVWRYALGRAKSLTYRHRALASIPPPRERPLAPAEVHDLRLALPWRNLGRGIPRDRVIAEANEALEEAPGNPTATLILASLSAADRRALVDRAVRARPDDARNWVLLGATLPDDAAGDIEAAFRRAVAVDPTSSTALNALAKHLLARQRAAEALPHARRAVELAPWSPAVLETASGVLEELGNCRGALALADRAVASLADLSTKERRDELSKRRERLVHACGPAR
jgi:tetratricopeptide (TPR) repeat protein